jgi:hypothetical protein
MHVSRFAIFLILVPSLVLFSKPLRAQAAPGAPKALASNKEMDWPRIQRGYQAITAQYGTTARLKNKLAWFAYKFQDAAVARQQFELIGDQWDRDVWRDRERFDEARDWAQKHS